jgi:hypothetical protein
MQSPPFAPILCPRSAAFFFLATLSLWLVAVLFLTRRFVPSHGHTLPASSLAAVTMGTSLALSPSAAAFPLPRRIVVMFDCCVLCHQHDASPPMGTRHDAVREIPRNSHGGDVPQNVIDGGSVPPPLMPIAPPHSPPLQCHHRG